LRVVFFDGGSDLDGKVWLRATVGKCLLGAAIRKR
jgi:hypothetical protein